MRVTSWFLPIALVAALLLNPGPPAFARDGVQKHGLAITDFPTAGAFGDVTSVPTTSVPTMFLFDSSGKTAGVFYGAPPDLHDRVERILAPLLR
jgi:hypothetical protein